jgi:signal peptide peptidase SppA
VKTYPAIVATLADSVWLIEPGKLETILGVLNGRLLGQVQADRGMLEALAAETQARSTPKRFRSVAVLPLVGTIMHRGGMMEESSGMVSTERWGREFDQLVADPEVGAIVLDVDSGGGTVDGVPELADKVYNARGEKPIVAVANTWMCSAAYFIASAADEIVATPSGVVGSIGVVVVHVDQSGLNEQVGLAYTYVTYGAYKAEGHGDAPLADEARQRLQDYVDVYGEQFVKAVARNRGVTPQTVRQTYGQGRYYQAPEALDRKMIDRVGTLEETIARLASGGKVGGAKKTKLMRQRLDLAERE